MVQIIFHTPLPSLSHKRFDCCSSSLPCSCSLCCDFISLHELVWRSTWWHKYYSKYGCKRDYCTVYLIHSVIISNPICTGGVHNERIQINIYPSFLNKWTHLLFWKFKVIRTFDDICQTRCRGQKWENVGWTTWRVFFGWITSKDINNTI
jgi:hypothetical protein